MFVLLVAPPPPPTSVSLSRKGGRAEGRKKGKEGKKEVLLRGFRGLFAPRDGSPEWLVWGWGFEGINGHQKNSQDEILVVVSIPPPPPTGLPENETPHHPKIKDGKKNSKKGRRRREKEKKKRRRRRRCLASRCVAGSPAPPPRQGWVGKETLGSLSSIIFFFSLSLSLSPPLPIYYRKILSGKRRRCVPPSGISPPGFFSFLFRPTSLSPSGKCFFLFVLFSLSLSRNKYRSCSGYVCVFFSSDVHGIFSIKVAFRGMDRILLLLWRSPPRPFFFLSRFAPNRQP